MTKYIFCILACAFLVLGFSNVSNKELQGFQKKTETSSNDIRYEAVSCCCVSSAGFDKPGKDSHSQFVDETSTCNVSAVSYTHLDVYKRQVNLPSGLISCDLLNSEFLLQFLRQRIFVYHHTDCFNA